MPWFEIDGDGHVPGVAAQLPPGYRVWLDASGNIGGFEPVEPAIEASTAPVTEVPVVGRDAKGVAKPEPSDVPDTHS